MSNFDATSSGRHGVVQVESLRGQVRCLFAIEASRLVDASTPSEPEHFHPEWRLVIGSKLSIYHASKKKGDLTKFLVGKDGKVIARFESAVTPESPEVTGAIEKALH